MSYEYPLRGSRPGLHRPWKSFYKPNANEQRLRDVCFDLNIRVLSLIWVRPESGCPKNGHVWGWFLNGEHLGQSTDRAIVILKERDRQRL